MRVKSERYIAGSLQGIAGSSGVARSPARLICGPEELDRLRPGEIVVTPFINPGWGPLFALAGGLICETGGALSMGAILAREYGIPAVLFVPEAMQRIADGELVTVDGDRGLVYLPHDVAVD
jgi:pyruvate,water dikinase